MNALKKKIEAEIEEAGGTVDRSLVEPWRREQVANGRMGDADIIGDLTSPESRAVMALPVVFGEAAARDVTWWARNESTWGAELQGLTLHPESAEKGSRGGVLFVDGGVQKTAIEKGAGVEFFRRKNSNLRKLYVVPLDFDGTAGFDDIRDRLQALGLFAVMYTTHSHAEKSRPGAERFRVFLPLAQPFEFGATVKERLRNVNVYAAHYRGFLAALAPGLKADESGSKAVQLMFLPTRPAGADYKHVVIAGRGLNLLDYPAVDLPPPARERVPGRADTSTHAVTLDDGFDLRAWWGDNGPSVLLSSVIDGVGELRRAEGAGFAIRCPNADAHSDPKADFAWLIDGADSDEGRGVIHCHHDHCTHLRTADFLALIAASAPEVEDGFDTFSAYLCNPAFYPDGEAPSVYDYGVLREVTPLRTANAVNTAWASIKDMDDTARASIAAGVLLGGNKDTARRSLDELLGGTSRKRDAVWRAGKEYLALWEDAQAQKDKPATETEGTWTPSLNVADPLGDTLEQALMTLSARFKIVSVGGKVMAIRNVDREGLAQGDTLISFWTKESIRQYYENVTYAIRAGRETRYVNPVDEWWRDPATKRYARVVFDPSPRERPNDVNLYDESRLELREVAGDASPIADFIRNIICAGDEASYSWVILWLAHLVQRPEERPGSALVLYGNGGAGKGTFGEIVRRLVAPYCLTVSDPSHLVGQFAGPLLSTSLVVVSEEAIYGKDPAAANKLKGMISQTVQQVEAKGQQAVQMDVFFRVIFDSNNSAAVRIEGNNSERRYMVLNVADAMINNREAFEALYAHINGPAMAAFLQDLIDYNPAKPAIAGTALTAVQGGWGAVRRAPETVHRKHMFGESLRPGDQALIEVLESGVFEWREGGDMFRVCLNEEKETHIPAPPFDKALQDRSGAFDKDITVKAAWQKVFGKALAKKGNARADIEHRFAGNGDEWKPLTGAGTKWCYTLPKRAEIKEALRERLGMVFDDTPGE